MKKTIKFILLTITAVAIGILINLGLRDYFNIKKLTPEEELVEDLNRILEKAYGKKKKPYNSIKPIKF